MKEQSEQDNPRHVSPWMTAEQTAAYLGVAKGTIYNLTSARVIPHVRRGRIVRFHRAVIDRWLSAKACGGRHRFEDMPVTKRQPCNLAATDTCANES